MTAYFSNPANGYIERATTSWTWLWALLFGPFFFLYKGAWPHALVLLVPAFLEPFQRGAGAGLYFLMCIAYSVMASRVVRKTYLRKGWTEAAMPTGRPIGRRA